MPHDIDRPRWADNPRLNSWLAAQRAAFPAWSKELGDEWDFSLASVGLLEDALKSRYADRHEADIDRDSPFAAVAAWYLGEVFVRNLGLVWRCVPEEPPTPPPAGGYPVVYAARESIPADALDRLDEDEAVGGEDDSVPWWPVIDPADTLRATSTGEGEWRLLDLVADCEEFNRWCRSFET
ncbi:hypothetical protein [Streptomyces rimosus]|uniref:hypothetical protein n=1 Tax=Streptomyces rimosus TaxID=1927 RepID=UPI00067E50CB|nr:hypothetical protein [Streptomyces rimosus]